MKILILGPSNEKLAIILKEDGHQIMEKELPIDVQFLKQNYIDFTVCYGYRHIIKSDVLNYMKKQIVNLHISYLPWNRGADPNLWSFLEDTKKGVSIHYIDEGIDTGDIISQKLVEFDTRTETLRTTYDKLSEEILMLFQETWPLIIKGQITIKKQIAEGTFHKLSDKNRFQYLLLDGWDTPVECIRGKALLQPS